MKFTEKLVRDGGQYQDHVGVEVELEHHEEVVDLPTPVRKFWRAEEDKSLRRNGVEYVFREPLLKEEAFKAIDMLGAHVDKTNKVYDVGRAGVHVHVNVGDLKVRELVNFLALAHVLDDLLVHWCGERRKGNLFCLRLRDAEFVTDAIVSALDNKDLDMFHTDRLRYASVNLKSIPQYGSVEFRSMRSDGDWEALKVWVGVLLRLKEVAKVIDNPIQIVSDCSMMSPENFVSHVLGEYSELFPRYPGFEDDVYHAIQRVQYYAYSQEW